MAQAGTRVSDFCTLVRSEELGRLKLTASRGVLFDEGTDLPINESQISLRTPSVPLTRILSSVSLKSDLERKILISYLIAKAAWQLYDSDWMSNSCTSWTKDTTHFMRQRLNNMQDKAMLDQRPFVSTGFGARYTAAHRW
ncbi:hypothetical protein CC86DRAFT_101901 [Ophiobolus disseminans]|uniref:Uncharacterized protein n=1 Tax=Ophiobolus disseminans TaxID=1469910 RepID=A0A6A6ZMJ8_9PLEO|nr:hypothetical protein CC86DRAFT_101901 [Ophiobolus disseminans]